MQKPLALTDSQLLQIVSVAKTLRRFLRDPFLKAVAEMVQEQPEIGEGNLHLICIRARNLVENQHWANQNMTISSREIEIPSSALRRADGGRWS